MFDSGININERLIRFKTSTRFSYLFRNILIILHSPKHAVERNESLVLNKWLTNEKEEASSFVLPALPHRNLLLNAIFIVYCHGIVFCILFITSYRRNLTNYRKLTRLKSRSTVNLFARRYEYIKLKYFLLSSLKGK